MKRLLIALSILLAAAVAVPAVAQKGKGKHRAHGPAVIQLPPGFGPEGIATARRHTFFVSSRTSGAIYRGSLRTGEGDTIVPADTSTLPTARRATGIKVDRRGRLFVSGAGSKAIRVYDARTGDELRSYPVPDAAFINDVIVTRRGAYFTDSNRSTAGAQQLYFLEFGPRGALPEPEEVTRIPLTGDLEYDASPMTFELNGIEAARGGRTLIAVQSRTGKLFTIDAATGSTREIDLGGATLLRGDGILRKGRTLYVVRNTDNLVAVVKLDRNLQSGRLRREITSDRFEVPTTIARSRGRLYVVNAKFGQEGPDTPYEVVKVPKR